MRKNIFRILHIASYSCLLMAVVACSSMPWPKFPTKINAQILASFDINPDANERPSPLVVRVYELKSKNAFDEADFFKLYDEEAATLGGDLLTREEFEISPGQGREIVHKADDQARYFGVIAAYRNIEEAHWRAIIPLELNKKNNLLVKLGKQTVTIKHQ